MASHDDKEAGLMFEGKMLEVRLVASPRLETIRAQR